ncbi:site-specific DNA-methyltransferase [Mycoplasmopsis agalactiae]|uniref:Type III restriction modification system:Methylase n=1 Tax=Mycoplasmopsis agalactiae TaxID=2110 RepID=D3VPJ5_MYCAA|nr:Type III restriction modification system:Methylase [Mycoplasmopsis agalactiae]
MTMNTIKQDYIEKANALSLSNELNQDQKDLIVSIINKFDDNDPALHNVYQLLIKRIKLGFVFDIAPSVNSSEIALLKKNESLSFNNDNNKPANTLIIGENYDALKNLIVIERERESQSETVNYDVIYIDPPYNTESSLTDGNNLSEKDEVSSSKFIYRDKFSRTGWLNMLNERLRLSHQLLKEDGVIFVSIDDSEHAYLKVLMDEIFGEENFIANIVWQKKNEGSGEDSKFLKILTEYVLVYANNIDKFRTNNFVIDTDDGSYKYSDEFVKTRGMYKLNQLDRASLTWSESLDFPISHNGKIYYPGGSEKKWQSRHSGNHATKDWQWRWSKEKINWGMKNNFLVFKNNKVYSKQYQFVDNNNQLVNRDSKFSNLIYSVHGSVGTSEQKDIFTNKIFDHPKPVGLLKFLINLHPNKNARILDFYAGSGTTGHAVMELNKEDGGNRSYTLVTNNENNIATNVCYERLYRINNGISTSNESNFDWIKKNNPYKSNLNVYNIEYYSTKLFDDSQSNINIKQQYLQMLQDFNIDTENKDSNIDILRSLTSLKPITKD